MDPAETHNGELDIRLAIKERKIPLKTGFLPQGSCGLAVGVWGIVRYKGRKVRLYFRGDAAFASPEMYEYLDAEGFLYPVMTQTNYTD